MEGCSDGVMGHASDGVTVVPSAFEYCLGRREFRADTYCIVCAVALNALEAACDKYLRFAVSASRCNLKVLTVSVLI